MNWFNILKVANDDLMAQVDKIHGGEPNSWQNHPYFNGRFNAHRAKLWIDNPEIRGQVGQPRKTETKITPLKTIPEGGLDPNKVPKPPTPPNVELPTNVPPAPNLPAPAPATVPKPPPPRPDMNAKPASQQTPLPPPPKPNMNAKPVSQKTPLPPTPPPKPKQPNIKRNTLNTSLPDSVKGQLQQRNDKPKQSWKDRLLRKPQQQQPQQQTYRQQQTENANAARQQQKTQGKIDRKANKKADKKQKRANKKQNKIDAKQDKSNKLTEQLQAKEAKQKENAGLEQDWKKDLRRTQEKQKETPNV